MGSGFRAGDMAVPSTSGSGPQRAQVRQPESDLVKVHTSPVRPFHVPSIQSIFQSIPKLYKYNPDQLEVLVHRRSGDVDTISSYRKNAAFQVGNGCGARVPPVTRQNDSDTSSSAKLMFEDERTTKKFVRQSSVAETVEGRIDKRDDNNTQVSSSQEAVVPECDSCDSLATLVAEREREIERLKILLEIKEGHLMSMQKEKNVLENENTLLKKNLNEVNDGMYRLCQTAQNSDSIRNHDKIMQLIERASSSSAVKDSSFKRMSFSLKKIREHVEQLSSVKIPKPIKPILVEDQENQPTQTSFSDGDQANKRTKASSNKAKPNNSTNSPFVSVKDCKPRKSVANENQQAQSFCVEVKNKSIKSPEAEEQERQAIRKLTSSPLSTLTLFY